jgi:hypothetical protein
MMDLAARQGLRWRNLPRTTRNPPSPVLFLGECFGDLYDGVRFVQLWKTRAALATTSS